MVVLEILVSCGYRTSERVVDTAGEPHVVIIEAKFRVNPRRINAAVQMAAPATIKGLLRPNLELELSAITPARKSANGAGGEGRVLRPMSGWTMRPERGPARKTRAIKDFERPREMRYGEATQLACQVTSYLFAMAAHRRPFRWTTSPAHP